VLNNTHVYTQWENVHTLDASKKKCAAIYTALEDVGTSYRGDISTTISGKTCRKWKVDTPHGYIFNPTQYPDAGLEEHNFCRNPDKRAGGAFCVTTDASVTTESCDVTGVWKNVDCAQSKPFLCERDF